MNVVAHVTAVAATRDGTGELRIDVLPARLRRGTSLHQRLVVDVLARLVDESSRATIRMVHGSEFGELETAVALSTSAEPTPARFSISVHSSAIGLASIAFGNRRGHTTLSAGVDTLVACLVDAIAGLSADEDVIVVVADESSAAFPGYADHAFSFGLRLSLTASPGAPRLALAPRAADADGPTTLVEACRRLDRALAAGGRLDASADGYPSIHVIGGGAP